MLAKNKIVIYILFVLSFVELAVGMLVPLWAGYVKHIGGDLRTVGVGLAIYALCGAISAVMFGKIQDHYWNSISWYRLSNIVILGASIGYFYVDSPWSFYIVQFGLGLGIGMSSPSESKLYQSMIKGTSSLMGWSYYNGLASLALGLAAIAGAYLAHHHGFTSVFYAIIAVSLLALFFSFFVKPVEGPAHAQ